MPKFFPDIPPDPRKSQAESRLYNAFRQLPPDWCVLHSVYTYVHARKRSAEADFLIISPKSVLVIEVKGGQVSRDNGAWRYTRSDGQYGIKPESPYQQAESAWHAIRGAFKGVARMDELLDKVGIGWGCYLPDCEMPDPAPHEWPQEMICDAERLARQSAIQAVSQMSDYVMARDKNLAPAKGKVPPSGLTPAEVEELASLLRPKFASIPSMFGTLQTNESHTWQLTVDQADAIWAAEDQERFLIHGPAGTGKTTIANLRFGSLRKQEIPARVALVCFNAALADHLVIENLGNLASPGGFVGTIHELLRQYSPKLKANPADHSGCLSDLRKWANENTDKPFDWLILDEGQDLRGMPDLCEALGCLLNGGWLEGRWIWLEDRSQSVLRQVGNEFSPPRALGYRLKRNIRNGRHIAEFANKFTENRAEPLDIFSHNITTRLHSTSNPVGRSAEVALRIKELVGIGFKEQHIVVLDYAGNNEALLSLKNVGDITLVPWAPNHRNRTIRCSTVRKFKGLEAPAVIIYNVDGALEKVDPLFYVAVTRAKLNLSLLAAPSVIESIQRNLANA